MKWLNAKSEHWKHTNAKGNESYLFPSLIRESFVLFHH